MGTVFSLVNLIIWECHGDVSAQTNKKQALLLTLRRSVNTKRFSSSKQKKTLWWHWEVQDQERRWQIIDHGGARLVSWDSGVGLQECLTIRTSGLNLRSPSVLLIKYRPPVQLLSRAVPVPDQSSVLIGQIKWIIIVFWQLPTHSNRLSKLGSCCWEGPRFF